ncbi:MAG: VOC family protein [Deltaproteobacteria bacterium]|nr:VOC family protein [Deltaproteobacteria bacterium]MCB9788313.1 VOC family protein [Deltaproteobacteria bacterium]
MEGIVFDVHNLLRSEGFYAESFDFALIARSTAALERTAGERTEVYEAGDIRVIVTSPMRPRSRSGRYLKRHPDGISSLIFEVEDLETTAALLAERNATFVDAPRWIDGPQGGRYGWFDITTPFGEALFRFCQRDGFEDPLPGVPRLESPGGGQNRMGFESFDHVTSNFLTLEPMVLWCKTVLGFEQYWDIAFHTDDVAPSHDHGSGLKSIVLWDPKSGAKFANNEPMRPHFEDSQIYTFVMDNHGPGIQHVAFTVADIIGTVRTLRDRGVVFMPTPPSYYQMLPSRLEAMGVVLEEDIEELRELEILVDGKPGGSYLLQIFLKEASGLYEDEEAGPFFFELIQRKGDRGFGEGNFRALFESIEREQVKRR